MQRKTLSATVGTVAGLAIAATGALVAWPDEGGDRPVTAAEKRARKAQEMEREKQQEEAGLNWGACPKELAAPRVQCGSLKVPLDYDDPDGRTIRIALTRMASSDPDRRRGVLLTNPGGPGYSGLGHPALLAKAKLPDEVQAGYDIIGMDPRGVGASSPVTCDMTTKQMARGNFPSFAENAAGVAAEAEHAKTVAEQCGKSKTAAMLPHLTTANTARDMDRVRAALGEEKVSYFGQSYGSYLGGVYATLFPDRGDRIVLDSNLGPGGYDVTAFRLLARGMEDRFPDFAAFVAGEPEYGLGSTPKEVAATYDDLAQRLTRKPVDGVDGTLFRGISLEYLFSDARMPELAKLWQALDKGGPLPSKPPQAASDNLSASRLHVLCNDSRWPQEIAAYQRSAAEDRKAYPMLGGSTGNVTPCAFWPEPKKGPVRIGDKGPSNILMVQNERDPGTPLVGARELREALGDRTRMVTADQGGHGVYPFGANTCANDAVTAFLVDGRRPEKDLACKAQRPTG
ncbi:MULTISPECIES: alpha/beta hydrolase [unclassified Streptomyces]|uniref:alpha/beta hydrolase n=1 Tax=unclassified Streptomyces TaxID=2593676 RepID=UPI002E18A2DA|nr:MULTISPECIES: alpha/beta hydrolase [unclassified Streptomyces]